LILKLTAKQNNRGRASRGRSNRRAPRQNAARRRGANPSDPTQVIRFQPSIFGFPDKLITKLRYCDYHNLAITSGALSSHAYRWNSTFDPNYSGGGHQPLYRDTYAGIYNFYSVVRAHAKITFTNTDVDNPFIIGCVTDEDATISTTYTTLMEQSRGKFRRITALSGSQSCVSVEMDWDCKTVLGIDPFDDATYKSAVGDNPTKDSFLIFWAQVEDGAATSNLGVTIELIQEVLWNELLTPTQS